MLFPRLSIGNEEDAGGKRREVAVEVDCSAFVRLSTLAEDLGYAVGVDSFLDAVVGTARLLSGIADDGSGDRVCRASIPDRRS